MGHQLCLERSDLLAATRMCPDVFFGKIMLCQFYQALETVAIIADDINVIIIPSGSLPGTEKQEGADDDTNVVLENNLFK